MRRLRLLFSNDGVVPLNLAALGLRVQNQPELLQCKWPNSRTCLPSTLIQGGHAFADYFEDELHVFPEHARVVRAEAIIDNGKTSKASGRALRKWRRLARSAQSPA